MPPKRKAAPKKIAPTLSALIDSEPEQSEDEIAPKPAAKKKPGRPATKKAAKVPEPADNLEGEVSVVVEAKSKPKPRGRPPKKAAPEPDPESDDDGGDEGSEPAPKPKSKPKPRSTKKPAGRGKKAEEEKEIAETQFSADEDGMEVDEVAPTPTQVHSKPPPADEDDEDDLYSVPAAKKKTTRLLDATERFKLPQLRETAPEKALEKYKALSKKELDAQAAVIASLRAELNRQKEVAAKARGLQAELNKKEKETARLQAKVADLTKTVQEVQKETTVLTAKLHQLHQKGLTMPGSAVKPGRSAPSGMEDGILTRAKEDLMADLTGLIVMSTKRESEGTLFECLQTGRNGTLHFKLFVRDRSRDPKLPNRPGQSPDDEEDEDDYIFIPVLNPQRDQYVISILPEYLRDEISFSREHAARFYQKINNYLERPPETGQEEDETDQGEEEETEEDSG